MGPLLATDRCCGLDPLDRAVYTLSWKYFSFLSFQAAVYELATTVYLVHVRDARQCNTSNWQILLRFQWFMTAFLEQLTVVILA
jgi:hypothetical protein